MAAVDLSGHGVVAHNRSCYQLWEHGDIEQQIAEMPLHRGLATIDVYQV